MTKMLQSQKYTWHMIDVNGQLFDLAFHDKKIIYISRPNAAFSEIEAWIRRMLPADLTRTAFNQHFFMEPDEQLIEEIETQFRAYFDGKISQFDLPFEIHGTDFQKEVWQTLTQIPYGQTWSYQHVADQLGKPSAFRAVANAIGKNPLMVLIPCHRVIEKSGGLGGYRGGVGLKERLIEIERITT